MGFGGFSLSFQQTVVGLGASLLSFLLSMVVIFVAARFITVRATLGRALLAVVCGAVLVFFLPPVSFVASLVLLALWLFVLKIAFSVSWSRSVFIAILIAGLNIALFLILKTGGVLFNELF